MQSSLFYRAVPGGRLVGSGITAGRLALYGVLLVALGIRIAVVWTQTYVPFVDETFQYFEQGHRLAFGAGLVPWEFQDGARSWLVPGLIAGLMRLTNAITADPLAYVRLIRVLCVVLSLAVVLAGFGMGRRRAGLAGGIVAGGFCAIWFDTIYFAPAVLTEVLAAHCAILAIWLGESGEPETPRREACIGALFGLAFFLRYQYAPGLLAAMLWRYRLRWTHWRWLLAGGLAVVVPVAGVLDALTWGTPFQSIWLNVVRNSVQGVSAGMGVEPPMFYLSYLAVALQPLPLLLGLAVLGAIRAPALALAAAVTFVEHSLVPHKEVRFIYLVIAAAPVLIGLGLVELSRFPRLRLERRFAMAGAALVLVAGSALSWWTGTVALGPRWQFERANVQVFLAANREAKMCGLAVRDVWFWETGGYTWLHRDVPLYFADYDPGRTLPGTDRKLSLIVMDRGRPVPQITGDRLGAAASRYSHMIAKRGDAEPGYDPVACFNDAARNGEPEVCLFRRPGGCS